MAINIYEELASNDMYRDAFMKPKKPGIPSEVRLWPDYLQELFCILSDQHLAAGFDLQEADRVAIGQVKESDRYQKWQKQPTLPKPKPAAAGKTGWLRIEDCHHIPCK